MKKNTYKVTLLALFFFFIIQISFAQLGTFSFNVATTNETCTGNGALQFTTSGTTSGATILYSIYLLPNQVTPLAITSNTSFTGLNAGTYKVIATQSLGGLSNMQEQNVVIQNLVIPIAYQVVTQQETCNNGSITVNVSQGNPTSYEIISGPVIVAPQNSNLFTGLQSGTYNIRVNDACGDGVVQTVTILQLQYLVVNNFVKGCQLINCSTTSGSFTVAANEGFTINYPLSVSFSITPASGGNTVLINQNVLLGSATLQSIFLNIPYNLGQNNYTISVIDACGNLFFNLGNSLTNAPTLDLDQQPLNSCVKQINLSLCDFLPPYNVTFLSFPVGFNPSLFNGIHPGPFAVPQIDYTSNATNTIPNGNYLIKVTDACGRTAQNSLTVSNFLHQIIVAPIQQPCSQSTYVIDNLGGPSITSVIITSAPTNYGFSLPHNVSFNISNGGFGMDLLPGTYVFSITDSCGNTNLSTLVILPKNPAVAVIGSNSPGCSLFTGFINIQATNTTLVTVIVTQAPAGYGYSLPHNVSADIIAPQNSNLFLPFLPAGNYSFLITTSCNAAMPFNANVPVFISQGPLVIDYKKGCVSNTNSVTIFSPNGTLQSMIITAAPPAFLPTLPYNVSFNISPNGRFYMNSLPAGLYTFSSVDVCGVAKVSNFNIEGYTEITNTVQIQGNCGSFNFYLEYIDNAISSPHKYWLQKLNPITNNWEHPLTGITYPAGFIPTTINSIELNNLSTQFNIASLGTFRVLKTFGIYSNGSSTLTNCIEEIKQFIFTGELEIESIYGLACTTGGSSVIVNAVGLPPLNYSITTKDGIPFLINNGGSNNFTGLQAGVYNFQVSDLCGNVVNSLLDITNLGEPEIIASNLCDGAIGQLSVQNFTSLNYQWWKGTSTSDILSTSTILIFNPFSNVTTPGTYYLRIFSPNSLSCIDRILEFTIPSYTLPNAGQNGSLSVCGGTNSVNLNSLLVGPYDNNGIWTEVTNSGGSLNSNLWSPIGVSFGSYVFKYKVTGFCNSEDDALVTVNYNETPSIPIITTLPQVCSGNSIMLSASSITNATYVWTGPNNFQSTSQNPVIENSSFLNSGIYNVKATSGNCESIATTTVQVNPKPSFTITAGCVAEKFTVLVIPSTNSLDNESFSYNWEGPNGYSSSQNPIDLNGAQSGIYTISVININGCIEQNQITIENTICTIPKGVSPNDDGSNDSFNLTGLGVTNLKIFNRYGITVYEQDNYLSQWNGQDYKGHLLPTATYYYFVTLESGEQKTGWVYLQRN